MCHVAKKNCATRTANVSTANVTTWKLQMWNCKCANLKTANVELQMCHKNCKCGTSKTANVELQMSQLQMCQLQMNQLFFQKIKNCKRGTANVSTAIVGNCKRLNGKLKKRLIRGGKWRTANKERQMMLHPSNTGVFLVGSILESRELITSAEGLCSDDDVWRPRWSVLNANFFFIYWESMLL